MSRDTSVTIALAQLNSTPGDPRKNMARAVDCVERAGAEHADLILFPELHLEGYRADESLATIAESIPGEATSRLQQLAIANDLCIIMGMARAEDGYPHCIYNSACVITPNGEPDYYDKVHLGSAYPYREGVFFARGRRAPLFDLPFGRASVQICYDATFPELTRSYVVRGSELNLVISAGPDEFIDEWDTMLRCRALENSVFTVYCNTVGMQKDTSFFGRSKIVGPDGGTRAEAKIGEEDFVIEQVDLEEARLRRRARHIFADRMPDVYEGLLTA